ncbi:MAG: efflux RND transporter periplasmic adaptor subunit [Wenzhouxiangella sp.]
MITTPRIQWLAASMLLLCASSLWATDWVAVERGPLVEHLRLDGVIEAVQQSTVSAQTSGTVVELPFDVDDVVDAGALIARLDDTEQRARYNQARANQTEAESGQDDAQSQFTRIEALRERGVATQAEFDNARNALAAARARLARTEAAVAEAREQLDQTRILAPYSGIVTHRHVELGEAVSPGTPLLSGFSLEELRVVVSIPQQFAELARRERRAEVSLDDGRVLTTGQMTFFPYADPATHSFRLRLALTEPDGTLFPGMLVRVGIPVSEREVLLIPESSLFRQGELRAVYVLDDQDRPRLRQVRIGARANGKLEVLAGLDEGERIAADPRRIARQTTAVSGSLPGSWVSSASRRGAEAQGAQRNKGTAVGQTVGRPYTADVQSALRQRSLPKQTSSVGDVTPTYDIAACPLVKRTGRSVGRPYTADVESTPGHPSVPKQTWSVGDVTPTYDIAACPLVKRMGRSVGRPYTADVQSALRQRSLPKQTSSVGDVTPTYDIPACLLVERMGRSVGRPYMADVQSALRQRSLPKQTWSVGDVTPTYGFSARASA